jgi:hypothetical protein
LDTGFAAGMRAIFLVTAGVAVQAAMRQVRK